MSPEARTSSNLASNWESLEEKEGRYRIGIG